MGRRRSKAETANLPPGLIARTRPSGTHYFLSRQSGAKREEVPLGKVLDHALAEYASLTPGFEYRPPDRAALAHELFLRAKKGAKQRGLEFRLEHADIDALLCKADGRCMLTGIPFDHRRPAGTRRRLWAPSLDRIKSSEGYVLGNVRVVVIGVNIAMSDFGEEFLLRIAHSIMRRQRALRADLRKSAE